MFLSCISHDFFQKVNLEVLFSVLRRLQHEKHIDVHKFVKALNNYQFSKANSTNPFKVSIDNFSGSTSENKNLLKLFLLICHSMIPFDNPLTDIFFVINDINDILKHLFFYRSWLQTFDFLAEKLLKFIRYELNLPIYPKLHYIIHYSAQIRKYGPLIIFSTYRFESCHRKFQKNLLASCNKKNFVKSMLKGVLNEASVFIGPETVYFDFTLVGKTYYTNKD